MIRTLVHEAVIAGAGHGDSCRIIGLDRGTLQRWRRLDREEDGRKGPNTVPRNKLTPAETAKILEVVNTPEFRDQTPNQIVPILAERKIFIGSESSIYRILKKNDQLVHRTSSRPAMKRHRPREHKATGRNQVWSWDITYLRSLVRGTFFYLYVVLDVWSRKIVGWAIHASESAEFAAQLVTEACAREGVDRAGLVLHSDNGSPMKGATLLTTLQALGVVPSFSRPSVSNDNPYSESQFRTTKYCPMFPTSGVFESLEGARAWMIEFTCWYNTRHRHSGIQFVTPQQRHDGSDRAILDRREATYAAAKRRHPERWAGRTRNWDPIVTVILNPTQEPAA
jgi:transposase InsO family protein